LIFRKNQSGNQVFCADVSLCYLGCFVYVSGGNQVFTSNVKISFQIAQQVFTKYLLIVKFLKQHTF